MDAVIVPKDQRVEAFTTAQAAPSYPETREFPVYSLYNSELVGENAPLLTVLSASITFHARLAVMESFVTSRAHRRRKSHLGFEVFGRKGSIFGYPPDRLLAIADVDWYCRHSDGVAGGERRIVLRLFVQSLDDPDRRERVFESAILLNAGGEGGTSEAMATGFITTTGAQLCVDTGENPAGPPLGLQHAILRGCFIPPS